MAKKDGCYLGGNPAGAGNASIRGISQLAIPVLFYEIRPDSGELPSKLRYAYALQAIDNQGIPSNRVNALDWQLFDVNRGEAYETWSQGQNFYIICDEALKAPAAPTSLSKTAGSKSTVGRASPSTVSDAPRISDISGSAASNVSGSSAAQSAGSTVLLPTDETAVELGQNHLVDSKSAEKVIPFAVIEVVLLLCGGAVVYLFKIRKS